MLFQKIDCYFYCGGCWTRKETQIPFERIDLLKEFIELFCEYEIDYLSADREFLGHHWLGYLLCLPTISLSFKIRRGITLE